MTVVGVPRFAFVLCWLLGHRWTRGRVSGRHWSRVLTALGPYFVLIGARCSRCGARRP